MRWTLRLLPALIVGLTRGSRAEPPAVDIGSNRELFVDHYLIDRMDNTQLRLQRPHDEGVVFQLDQPWEGKFCAYFTVIHAAENKYQMYYRGLGHADKASDKDGATCYAESKDGKVWEKPPLDLNLEKEEKTNILLAAMGKITHNFSPFIDTNPACKPDEKYKAMGGYDDEGLFALTSPDGIHWKKVQEAPVFTRAQAWPSFAFDSQNVSFWSESERKYLLFFRVYKDKNRRIARAQSDDFAHWHDSTLMEYRAADGSAAPIEQLYTNQTAPYFRAPQINIATAARFMQHRQVITTQEAVQIGVDPHYFNDSSDAIFMTNRGDAFYDRTFMTGLIWPAIGLENWTSRTNYPALGIVQTGPAEMSLFVNQNYAQPTANLHRYSFRLDGLASLHAEYQPGEMTTKPLKFEGTTLTLNYATSAAGGIRVGLEDADGHPIDGFGPADQPELIGNELSHPLHWTGGDLSKLSRQPIRLHFLMHDADVFAMKFETPATPASSPASSPTP